MSEAGKLSALECQRRLVSACPHQHLPKLVSDGSTGREPLCKFLDKPIPDKPFPCSNSFSDFAAMTARMEMERVVKTRNRLLLMALASLILLLIATAR